MKIHQILSNLTKYDFRIYGKEHLEDEICSIRFAAHPLTEFSGDILYICPSRFLQEQPAIHTGHFLCYGTPDSIPENLSKNLLVLLYSGPDDIHLVFNEIQPLISDSQKSNAALQMMTNAFFSDQGLQFMTDTAYQIFDNPVFVIDSSYKYLAISSGLGPDNDFVARENANGYIAEQGIRFIKESHLEEKLAKSGKAYYYNPLFHAGMMAAAVSIHGITIGKVMLYEKNHPLADTDGALLEQFSRFVAMELQKNQFFQQNKDIMYSYFLADLLDSKDINYPSIRDRLHTMGMDLKDDLYILTISASSYHHAAAKLEVIVSELNRILTGAIYAIYENSLVLLFSRARENTLTGREEEALASYLKENNLYAGISNFFTDLKGIRRFYLQAKCAAEIGNRLRERGPVFYYSDLYFYHIMEICEEKEKLQYFIHPAMMKLLYYDQEKNSELLNTMQIYLQNPGSTAKIASELHIHKNTLLYRMNKIKELTGCSLENGDEMMSLSFSYKIMRYLNMLPDSDHTAKQL
ncbi:Sugar diacid regulator [uncultured Roseburia sp.]|uniref:Helix-turn-helix domain-containing protein n=1 Tax=Brotonthovivens ammoniilytica TaxID=2981725 RepID=A0ABT2TJG7_9FIRM|nr:helix-turn-helix domain-containing protein [Brotonthovivens ammoniilytica]MCU6761821.1 helix-turn-helix domain-containing protein [Brotonthovivens ammoniilytica]SCI47697.1 Sugar diacid regulator [uncultured Roseburia sp.]